MMRTSHSLTFRSTLLAAAMVCGGFAVPGLADAQAKRPAPRKPLQWSAPIGTPALTKDLQSLLDRSVRTGRWGVLVVSLTQGDTLFGSNVDTPLLPASTMKVFTSALALDYLGPYHQFETQVVREGEIDSAGVLRGDLVLRGAGDPSLGATDGGNAMQVLARQVAAAGVTQVTGRILGDGSAFDGRRVPDGWAGVKTPYAARVSALSYNQNVVRVTVRPVNGKAVASLAPSISGVPITTAVSVRAGSRGAAIRIQQDVKTGAFRISGWIGARSPARGYSYMIDNPDVFAAAAFRSALVAEGIKVDGGAAAGVSSDTATRVAGIPSKPLSDLVARMNGESNNHFAELLFRNTARVTGGVGSADTGNALLRSFLADKVGVPATDFYAADGSGLSRLDRVTPRSLVSVLDYSSRAPWASVFSASLPIAGVTETLASRMRGAPAQGRLRAKTGTTAQVISLGGYVTAASGEELAFAFIYNGTDRTRARQAIDAMGSTLAAFSR
jgi:D-alanyl-D-alanine carboxypeptidase/D-alanyl-D-alanine-endopeptidase (penicillin-binding protein 4)